MLKVPLNHQYRFYQIVIEALLILLYSTFWDLPLDFMGHGYGRRFPAGSSDVP